MRTETPGVGHRLHLNNAGASLMPRPVVDAVTGHLWWEAEIGGYEAAAEAAGRLAAVYASVGRLINASRDEISLKENATVAWQMAFHGLAMDFRPGDRILTARAAHAANYIAFLQVARRTGAVIEVIADDAQGVLDPEALERMLDERVRLIAITWVPTNGGLVNPAAAVDRIARRHHIPYLLDACQAVGQMPVGVEAIGCDYALALGLEAIEARCRDLADSLRRGLRTIPGVTLHDVGSDPAAIVSFSMAGIDAERVKQGCAAASLNLSVSTPSSTLLDATARGLPDLVRALPHYFNSEDEIARAIAVIRAQARAHA